MTIHHQSCGPDCRRPPEPFRALRRSCSGKTGTARSSRCTRPQSPACATRDLSELVCGKHCRLRRSYGRQSVVSVPEGHAGLKGFGSWGQTLRAAAGMLLLEEEGRCMGTWPSEGEGGKADKPCMATIISCSSCPSCGRASWPSTSCGRAKKQPASIPVLLSRSECTKSTVWQPRTGRTKQNIRHLSRIWRLSAYRWEEM